MAHELDQIAGHVSYADARRDAWHQLGQQVGHAMTAREALRAAHLADWNVRKLALVVPQEPIITEAGVTTPAPLPVPDQWATVRTNPINGQLDVLGVVGNKYEPMQNEASCDLLDALTGKVARSTRRGGRPTRHDQTMLVSPAAMSVHATRSTANELMNRRRPRASRTLNPRILDTL